MSVARNQVSAVELSQIDESVNADDQLIIFLDAASDSNAEVLQSTLAKMQSPEGRKKLLTFQDGDLNTALHFGAKNGNWKICQAIVDEAEKLGITSLLINCRNNKGFTPLILVSKRGYHLVGDKDDAVESRYRIIAKFLSVGADPNYSKP